MRIDRVKLIAEMARRDIGVQQLSEKACVSRATITALRGGKRAVTKIQCAMLPLH